MRSLKYLLLGLAGLASLIVIAVLLSIPASIYEKPEDLLAADNSTPLVLHNVNVIDVETGSVARGENVYIREGRIERISSEPVAPETGYQVINVDGAYLSPGLFDMHVHLHDRKYLARNLAFGVTSVRNLRGLPMHLRWRRELAEGDWLGSNLWTSSPVLDGEKYADLLQQVTRSPAQGRELVRLYKELGYDSIKAYGYLDADVFLAVSEEAGELGIPVVKHGPNPVAGTELRANAGMQSLEHVEDIFQGPLQYSFDLEKLGPWLQELKQIDPYVTPTLATFDHLTLLSRDKDQFVQSLDLDTLNPVYRFLLGEFSVKRWLAADEAEADFNARELAFLQQIVGAMDEAGIKLLVGSDAGTMFMLAGSSLHREIALMSAAGLTNLTVLQAASINAASALNVAQDYGSIAEGKIADAVVTAANPLDDLGALQHPLAVIKNGQWLPEGDLAALKESARQPTGTYLAMGRLLEDLLTRALFHP